MRWSEASRLRRAVVAIASLALLAAAPTGMDPENPTCPKALNWTSYPEMRFTLREEKGRRVLLAEGKIDTGMVTRLADAIETNKPIQEIWLRSPGGSASIGNEAGRLIRSLNIATRIPATWACFSACNFVFMGGPVRWVDPGGLFVVHMFTHLSDRDAVKEDLARGTDEAIETIGDIEQGSALLASDDNDFLIRMGVSRKLLTEVMYRQKAIAGQGEDRSTRRCLTQDELFRYRVTNVR
ncbi:hypothetical protein [Sphingomonas sp. LaA6.9]|uniref:COG3904 family protein n=1 Tax=Sphingomonas sp. LaA6.9 TaxID=2919914 RepID=UPI001F501A78|nr:hypothetical protein [Sphingomonas sp. LaA6.9]MCJ8158475.1 hypothetical protein [Sphingomonas sp. LaA6.9]